LKWGSRLTTFPAAGVRLPIPFVRLVLEILASGKITSGKAADLLMVRRHELTKQFGVSVAVQESY